MYYNFHLLFYYYTIFITSILTLFHFEILRQMFERYSLSKTIGRNSTIG